MYGGLFTELVRRINESINKGPDDDDDDGGGDTPRNTPTQNTPTHGHPGHDTISLLDIFGFESFETNSFEQLCINYCNESLQSQFNAHVFSLSQAEYTREGLTFSSVSFSGDNTEVVEFLSGRHTGVFAILDESCFLQRRGDARDDDRAFREALYKKCEGHARFEATHRQRAGGKFGVVHYAGTVEYDAKGFVEKNKDVLPRETTELLDGSSLQLVRQLSRNVDIHQVEKKHRRNSTAKSLTSDTVSSQFTFQLRQLIERINKSRPHYIRCLKANDYLRPDLYDPVIISEQLKCGGVVEAIRVSRVGFPHRFGHEEFWGRYWVIMVRGGRGGRGGRMIKDVDKDGGIVEKAKVLVDAILEEMGEPQGGCLQVGVTKVYSRRNAFEYIERRRDRVLRESAVRLQARVRGFVRQSSYKRLLESARRIQTIVRMAAAVKRTTSIRRNKASIVIQKYSRRYSGQLLLRRARLVASFVQTRIRGHEGRCIAKEVKKLQKTVMLQSFIRMSFLRHRHNALLSSSVVVQCLVRARKARRTVKERKRELRDLSTIARERDELREKTKRMEIELREAREAANRQVHLLGGGGSPGGSVRSGVSERSGFEEAAAREIEELKRTIQELKLANGAQQLEPQQPHAPFTSPTRSTTSTLTPSSIASPFSPAASMKSPAAAEVTNATAPGTPLNKRNQNTNTKFSPDPSPPPPPSQPTLTPTPTPTPTPTSRLVIDKYVKNAQRGQPAIHIAVSANDSTAVQYFISRETDPTALVNSTNRDLRTPLHLACLNGSPDIASLLLRNNAVSNAQDHAGDTPLNLVESDALTRILIDAGANPNIPNNAGWSSLHEAVKRGDFRSARILIETGADVNSVDDDRFVTPLHLLLRQPFDVSFLNLFLKADGIDMSASDREGNTPLHCIIEAAKTGDDVELVWKFIQAVIQAAGGVNNLNKQNNKGLAPIHLLARPLSQGGEERSFAANECLHLLINNGADINIQTNDGRTLLHMLLVERDFETAKTLVQSGAGLMLEWRKGAIGGAGSPTKARPGGVFQIELVTDEAMVYNLLSSITSPPIWVDDNCRVSCMSCKVNFGKIMNRRHHCRHCGRLVCNSCSPAMLPNHFFPEGFKGVLSHAESKVCRVCEQILCRRVEAGIKEGDIAKHGGRRRGSGSTASHASNVLGFFIGGNSRNNSPAASPIRAKSPLPLDLGERDDGYSSLQALHKASVKNKSSDSLSLASSTSSVSL